MARNWDWQVFLRDNGGGVTYGEWLLSAWGWTLAVSLLSLLVAIVVGTLIGVLRTVPTKGLAFIGDAWTELFRNIPLLVQVFIWYQVLPTLFPALQTISSFFLVVIALGLFTSARVSELVRSGLQSLSRGQRQAGLAIGLSLPQTYRYVLLPVALRVVLPPLTSEAMGVVKNSAVAFAVSVSELTMFAMQAQEETSRSTEIYLVVTALYFVSAFAVNRALGWIEQRARVPGLIIGVA